jgi:hypothetical protein
MKTLVKGCLSFLVIIFFCGCINKIPVDKKISKFDASSNKANENYNWLTEYGWYLQDGRHLVDPSIDQIDWIGEKAPLVSFEKFYMPANGVLYQVRLRKELFYFLYQTEEKNKLFPIGSTFGTEVFDLEFGDDFSSMALIRNGTHYGRRDRVGQQIDSDYPLVGIWGKLPALNEYRLANTVDCVYYMEIDKEIPGWAVREGTYLFKKTEDNIFETISSFSDGYIRLEIKDEKLLLLTPLFTLSEDEEGWIAPLTVHRMPWRKNDFTETENE